MAVENDPTRRWKFTGRPSKKDYGGGGYAIDTRVRMGRIVISAVVGIVPDMQENVCGYREVLRVTTEKAQSAETV